MAAIHVSLKSKFRGCILGAIVGECMGARFDSHSDAFASVSSKTEPSSLRNQIPRSGGRFLFPFGADSLTLLSTTELLLDSVNYGGRLDELVTRESVLAKLQSTLKGQSGESSTVKWGTGTRQVLESEIFDNRTLRSNCGVTRSLVAGLIDPTLATPICAATHTGAVHGAETLAEAVRVALLEDRIIVGSDVSHRVYSALVNKAARLATNCEYAESDEFEIDLQNKFAANFGADASAKCAIAAAVFAVHRTLHSLPHLDASSEAYRAQIERVSAAGRATKSKGMTLNTLGNSNRLDAAQLFARLTPSIEQDLPVAIATNWAISLGGDTKSNAFLAGGLAGAIWGEAAIPEEWLMFSEGVDIGRKLADELFAHSGY